MASISTQPSASFGGQAIARIVGFTCLFGFLVDMIALALPFGAGAAWRATLLQQMGDRSIVLLIGIGLLLLQQMGDRSIVLLIGIGLLSLGRVGIGGATAGPSGHKSRKQRRVNA